MTESGKDKEKMKKSGKDKEAAIEAAIAVIMAAAEMQESTVICRDDIGVFTGGALSPRYLANLDSRGEGPEGSFKLGRKKLYPVASLCNWLIKRLKA